MTRNNELRVPRKEEGSSLLEVPEEFGSRCSPVDRKINGIVLIVECEIQKY